MNPEDIITKLDEIVKEMKGVHEYAYEHTLLENAEWLISTLRSTALELKQTQEDKYSNDKDYLEMSANFNRIESDFSVALLELTKLLKEKEELLEAIKASVPGIA